MFRNYKLSFYQVKYGKDIKTIKIGKYESGENIILLNFNNLVIDFNHKLVLVLIDTKKE